jgi:anti-sigma factor RsiW
MYKCNWETEVQRWFDGEANDDAAVAQHLASCDACRAFADELTGLRDATRTASEGIPGVPDMQMSAFLAGIRQKIEEESVASPAWRFHWGRLWTFASLAAAALIVAVSALIMFNPKPEKASATVVESVKTEVDGANVKPYKSKDGSATVWVNLPQDDVW